MSEQIDRLALEYGAMALEYVRNLIDLKGMPGTFAGASADRLKQYAESFRAEVQSRAEQVPDPGETKQEYTLRLRVEKLEEFQRDLLDDNVLNQMELGDVRRGVEKLEAWVETLSEALMTHKREK